MLRVSEEFYNLINRFSYNEVVKKLKTLCNSYNTESDYNFIKVSDSNKFITFLSNSKVKEISEKNKNYKVISVKNLTHSDKNDHIFEALGYDKNCEYWYPSEDHQGTLHGEVVSEKTGKTYVLFKSLENGRYSVINREGLVEIEPNLFHFSKNKLKIGRFVTHIFEQNNIDFTPSQVEEFVNLYKSTFDILQDKFSLFRIVDGKDISHWYYYENYENRNGTLGGSCMSNSDSNFFKIYEENKNCKMIILKSDNGIIKDNKIISDKIVGRALLWDAKIVNGDEVRNIKFMDRVYTNNDSDKEIFIKWAQKNGWWYKTSQTYYPDTTITNGEEFFNFDCYSKRIEVDIENIYFDKYPFIDTFCYIKDEKTLINNYMIDSEKETCHGFRSTGGYYETYESDRSIKRILE